MPVRNVANRFAWSVALLVVLSGCLVWTSSAFVSGRLLQQQADSLGQALAEQTATQITELVLANDLVSLNVVVSRLVEDSAVQTAEVFGVGGTALATASSPRTAVQPLFSLPWQQEFNFGQYTAQIQLADSVAGVVSLGLDLSYVEAGLNQSLLLATAALALLIALAVLMIRASFQNLVSFPARLLAFALSNIRKGDIDTCPEPSNSNELSAAIRQYNATAEYLARNAFLNNIKHRAPDENEEKPGAAAGQLDVTLLCVQLSNFSYLASTLSPERLSLLLNKYHFLASKVSQLYNGEVAFCSDGEIIVSFAMDELNQEHAFYALCAGQLLLQLAADIGDSDQPEQDSLATRLRIAVHSGPMLRGLYSPISGKSNLLMGNTLDQIRTICVECPDNALLCSQSCIDSAGGSSRISSKEFAQLGEQGDLHCHLCLELMADYQSLIERQALQLVTLYSGDGKGLAES